MASGASNWDQSPGDEEVDRVLGLGATLVNDLRDGADKGWAVLADPEGNEFCVLTPFVRRTDA